MFPNDWRGWKERKGDLLAGTQHPRYLIMKPTLAMVNGNPGQMDGLSRCKFEPSPGIIRIPHCMHLIDQHQIASGDNDVPVDSGHR